MGLLYFSFIVELSEGLWSVEVKQFAGY